MKKWTLIEAALISFSKEWFPLNILALIRIEMCGPFKHLAQIKI